MSSKLLFKAYRSNFGLGFNALGVLRYLCNNFNDSKGYAWPSEETIAQLTSLSKRSVSRAKNELKEAGLINWRSYQETPAKRAVCIYTINAGKMDELISANQMPKCLPPAATMATAECQNGAEAMTECHPAIDTVAIDTLKETLKNTPNDIPAEYLDNEGEFSNSKWTMLASKQIGTADGGYRKAFKQEHIDILQKAYSLSAAKLNMALRAEQDYRGKDDDWLIILPDICKLLAHKNQTEELWNSFGNGAKPPSFLKS
jgi:hypothetical protein